MRFPSRLLFPLPNMLFERDLDPLPETDTEEKRDVSARFKNLSLRPSSLLINQTRLAA
jgi:hypothetical protein